MSEEKQDLEDYIQYNFDDIPSFKLGIFLNSGEIQVKVALGQVEQVFLDSLISTCSSASLPSSLLVDGREFSQKSEKIDKIYVAASESSRIFVTSSEENVFIVYSCGKTSEKDENRIKELMYWLMH